MATHLACCCSKPVETLLFLSLGEVKMKNLQGLQEGFADSAGFEGNQLEAVGPGNTNLGLLKNVLWEPQFYLVLKSA